MLIKRSGSVQYYGIRTEQDGNNTQLTSPAFAVRLLLYSGKGEFVKKIRTILFFVVTFAYFSVTPKTSAFMEALSLVDRGHYRAASQRLESLISKDLDGAQTARQEMHHVLGYCYEKQKKWTEAVKHYQQAISPTYPLADYAIYHLATTYHQMQDYPNAIAWYQRLITEHPESFHLPKAKFEIAIIFREQKDYAKALAYLLDLIADENSGYVRQAIYEKGRAYEGLRDWKNAQLTYQQLIDANTSDYRADIGYQRLRKLLMRHPELTVTRSQRFNHGMVLYNRGQRTVAIQEFRKVARGHQDALAAKATYYIGRSYHRKREYSLAIKEYAKVVSLYPTGDYLTRALYQTTLCYRRTGNPDMAEAKLKAFIEQYSWSELADNALHDLGWVLENVERYDDAISFYRRLTHKYSQSELVDFAYWRIGWIQFKRKQYNESLETFRTLMELFPGNKYAMAAHFWTAKIHERLSNGELAEKIYREVVGAKHWYYSGRARIRLKEMNQKSEATETELTSAQRKTFANSPGWEHIGTYRSPRVKQLMRLKLYEDAVTELAGKIKYDNTHLKDRYYNIIVCYQKQQRFRDAYIYAEKLIAFNAQQDKTRDIPLELHRLRYPIYYADIIEKYARKYDLDPLFVASTIFEESRFRADAISWAGAIGLMQLMPATGRSLASKVQISGFSKAMLTQPEVNIHLGVNYLKYLMDTFENNHSLVTGAYNGGPGRMKRWLKEAETSDLDEFIEDIPINETRRHIKKVMNSYHIYQELYTSKSK